jgi:hypothetical protein
MENFILGALAGALFAIPVASRLLDSVTKKVEILSITRENDVERVTVKVGKKTEVYYKDFSSSYADIFTQTGWSSSTGQRPDFDLVAAIDSFKKIRKYNGTK